MGHSEPKSPAGMPFLRLNFARLWVRDQERSRRFFLDQLGFETIVDVENSGQGRWIVVAPRAPDWLPGPGLRAGLPALLLQPVLAPSPADGICESRGHQHGQPKPRRQRYPDGVYPLVPLEPGLVFR